MEDIVKVKPGADIRIVYPGINVSSYPRNMKTEYDDFILFIGRLVFYKNVDLLLKAFQYVMQKLPKAKLVIVGEGPMKNSWMRAAINLNIHRNTLFLGNVSTSEKIELLRKCSALALPSVFEGFGLVILEAFAMTKPVLVSDVKPFDEIVDDGKDGFILPRDNPIIWSEKIQFMLSNKMICKKMGENGYPKVNGKFSQLRSMDQMEQLYKEIISADVNQKEHRLDKIAASSLSRYVFSR
jgi:glycosyltransferase involved in cell wall biosynthesis